MILARGSFSRLLWATVILIVPDTTRAIEILQPSRAFANPDPPGAFDSNFGFSVNQFDGNLLVGAPNAAGGPGAVYLLNINTGAQILKLTTPETMGTPISFGRSVLQAGPRIVVGDSEANIGPSVRAGSAYVFDGQTGQPLLTIRDPQPATFGNFATSMEFAAGRLFSNSQSTSSNTAGRVHAFDPTNGQFLNTISNPQAGSGGQLFGFDLEEHQSDLFVSAPGNFAGGVRSGTVYRFSGQTLTQTLQISPPVPQNGSNFGFSLDSDASRLLVGAPNAIRSGIAAGEAHLFNADTGALLQTFVHPEPSAFARFGSSVALVGNYAVIGSPGTHSTPDALTPPLSVGAAYVFDAATGSYLAKLPNPHGEQNEQFTLNGGAQEAGLVAIGNQLVAAGWLIEDGTVYVYSNVPEPSTFVLLGLAALSSFIPSRGLLLKN